MTETVPIPLAAITPSPTNPRKRFDQKKLEELGDSIKSKGVLQPILVRPLRTVKPTKVGKFTMGEVVRHAGKYELVVGERRWRSSAIAGQTEIPAIVRDLTDLEVAEIQCIENDQREDVLPSERAAAYRNLVELGRSVEDLAAQVGKSVSWVRGILKLGQLSEDVLDAVDSGFLDPSTAELIARVPGEKNRRKVELCVLQSSWNPDAINARGKCAEEPLSYRDTKALIQRDFQVELKGSPFSQKDAELLPEAGSCDACPKKAGNAGEEYAQVRADMCLDPVCFRSKIEALRKREEAEAKAGGKKVLSKSEAKDLFCGWTTEVRLQHNAPYMILSQKPDGYQTNKPLQKLIGKAVADQVVVAYDEKGRRVELVPKAKATAALKAAGVKSHRAAEAERREKKTPEQKAAEEKQKQERALRERTESLMIEQIAQDAERLARVNVTGGVLKLLRRVTVLFADGCYGDRLDAIVKRLDLESAYQLSEKLDGMTFHEVIGVLAELVAGEAVGAELDELAKAFSVDRKSLEKRARQELKGGGTETKKGKPETNGSHAEPVDECDESTEEHSSPKKTTVPRPSVADFFATAPKVELPPSTIGHANGHHANGNGKPAEPTYAFSFTVFTSSGEKVLDVVAPTEEKARKKLKLGFMESVTFVRKLTRQQYEAAHGSHTAKAH